MQTPTWIGSHGINRALRFDNVWPSLDIWKGNDTDIYFAAKTSGPSVILDEYGFELSNVDLTGCKVMFIISDVEKKDTSGNDLIILVKTSGDTGGIAITDAINGKMIISLLHTDFSATEPGIYNCEVVIQDTDEKVHTLAKSVLNLIHSVADGVTW